MKKILVIQTAFIGDVVLATGVLEKLHQYYPNAQFDILVRKGNESLFNGHPFIHEVLIWQKKEKKYLHLWLLVKTIRSKSYDIVINLQRFAAMGLLTGFSKARLTIGFDKNPLSFLFDKKIKHQISGDGQTLLHEINRNHSLIEAFTDSQAARPRLYPTSADRLSIEPYQHNNYICIAPASVWFTKQFPKEKWISFIQHLPHHVTIYLIGGPGDATLCQQIVEAQPHPSVINLAGKMGFLQSAALQQSALMNYVNDSAPMHFASSVDAPVTAVYCSTVVQFGFGPLSSKSYVVETPAPLNCRPCGLHGKKACPQGHFNCANLITNQQLLDTLTPIG